MPTLRRTPFNQGGSLVSDPMDAIDASNRSAAMNAAQFGYASQQSDLQSQLALARLREQGREFDAGRQDNVSLATAALGAQNHSTDVQAGLANRGLDMQKDLFGQQFGYMTGRDKMLDDRYTADREWERDPTKNPALMAQSTQADAMKEMVAMQKLQAARQESNQKRADEAGNAVVFTPSNDQERETYQADVGAGLSPATAALDVKTKGRERAKAGADLMAEDLGRGFQRFNAKDTAFFSGDPTDSEAGALEGQFKGLIQRYKESGMSDADATQAARNAIEKAGLSSGQGTDFETDYFADKTKALLQRLGMR